MPLKQKVVKGFAWALLERFSTQGVAFLVSLVLARLLTPSDYGTIALLTIFITVSQVLADSGFGQALIQKKEATETDFNSVFWLSLVLSSVMYGGLFFAAPWIADFYDDTRLVAVLRVLSLTLIFHAVNSVQNAELNRKLRFDLSFRISLIGVFVTGCVGVSLALCEYGVWALVWSTLAGGVAGVVTRWFFIAWRPRLIFSWHSVQSLFRFGWKMTVSALLDTGYNNLYGLLIGKLYSKADLAFVNKGRSVPQLAMDSINSTLGRVAFPALAQVQDQRETVRNTMRKMIRGSTFLVFPMMTGVACCADAVVPLLFGDQWHEAVPYVRLACFTFALWPFHTINLQAITALGRSDIFLTLEVVKKIVGLTLMLGSVRFGVWWMMAVTAFAGGPLSVVINCWPNRKLLGYSVGMQVRDVLPTTLLCGVMTAVLALVSLLPISDGWRLAVQIPLGVLSYTAVAFLLRLEVLQEVVDTVKVPAMARCPRGLRSILRIAFRYLLRGDRCIS